MRVFSLDILKGVCVLVGLAYHTLCMTIDFRSISFTEPVGLVLYFVIGLSGILFFIAGFGTTLSIRLTALPRKLGGAYPNREIPRRLTERILRHVYRAVLLILLGYASHLIMYSYLEGSLLLKLRPSYKFGSDSSWIASTPSNSSSIALNTTSVTNNSTNVVSGTRTASEIAGNNDSDNGNVATSFISANLQPLVQGSIIDGIGFATLAVALISGLLARFSPRRAAWIYFALILGVLVLQPFMEQNVRQATCCVVSTTACTTFGPLATSIDPIQHLSQLTLAKLAILDFNYHRETNCTVGRSKYICSLLNDTVSISRCEGLLGQFPATLSFQLCLKNDAAWLSSSTGIKGATLSSFSPSSSSSLSLSSSSFISAQSSISHKTAIETYPNQIQPSSPVPSPNSDQTMPAKAVLTNFRVAAQGIIPPSQSYLHHDSVLSPTKSSLPSLSRSITSSMTAFPHIVSVTVDEREKEMVELQARSILRSTPFNNSVFNNYLGGIDFPSDSPTPSHVTPSQSASISASPIPGGNCNPSCSPSPSNTGIFNLSLPYPLPYPPNTALQICPLYSYGLPPPELNSGDTQYFVGSSLTAAQILTATIMQPLIGSFGLFSFLAPTLVGAMVALRIPGYGFYASHEYRRMYMISMLLFLCSPYVFLGGDDVDPSGLPFGLGSSTAARLFTGGTELFLIVMLIDTCERFSDRLRVMLNVTYWLRRIGSVALSVWIFRILQTWIVILFDIATGWGGNDGKQYGWFSLFVVIPVQWLMWFVLVWLWDRYAGLKYGIEWWFNYVGTRGWASSLELEENDEDHHHIRGFTPMGFLSRQSSWIRVRAMKANEFTSRFFKRRRSRDVEQAHAAQDRDSSTPVERMPSRASGAATMRFIRAKLKSNSKKLSSHTRDGPSRNRLSKERPKRIRKDFTAADSHSSSHASASAVAVRPRSIGWNEQTDFEFAKMLQQEEDARRRDYHGHSDDLEMQ